MKNPFVYENRIKTFFVNWNALILTDISISETAAWLSSEYE